MLGVRYKIVRKPELFGYYESEYKNSFYDLEYNRYSLPLGFLINYKEPDPEDNMDLITEIASHNSFAFQEFTLSEFKGERIKAYEKINYDIEDVESDEYSRYVKIRFVATSDKPVWIYCKDECGDMRVTTARRADLGASSKFSPDSENNNENGGGALLIVNGENRYPFVSRISTMCIYLGTFKPGDKVEVEAACINKFEDPWLVYYNTDECNDALKQIAERGFEVTYHGNGVIKGEIDVVDDGLLVMTLPYMKGYRVKVDGKRTEYGAYRDALFALKMGPGEHFVEIS